MPSPSARSSDLHEAIRDLSIQRWRKASALTIAIVVVYFGFILLVAYGRDVLSIRLADGLSLGILLGALVIVSAWLLTYVYVSWANRVYDPALKALREQRSTSSGTAE